ncbi:hypothetical protein RhiirA4_482151 [Rhizophagus irregularis]|uniref:Uncharacterized protein n=1 Tax=Rhizophagus irregularis TaxID=588596 RepID=A0A2I1HKM8_9GLOM|nr:hypothetical protein RhiirA4_482151 [Rhizophagus irregularis]
MSGQYLIMELPNLIARDGNFSCKKQLPFGYGFYSTPDIDEQLMIRIPNIETGIGEYWISSDGNNLRPYSICIRKLE